MKYSIYGNKKLEQLKKQTILAYQQGLSLRAVGKLVGRSYGWVHLVVKEKLGDNYMVKSKTL